MNLDFTKALNSGAPGSVMGGDMSGGEFAEFRKALEAGYGSDMGNLTGGGALRIQSLEKTLIATIAENKHFRLFNKLAKGNALATVDEWTEQDSVGAVVLGDYLGLAEGQKVRCTGRILEVADFQSSYGRYPDHPGRGLAEWFKEHGVHTPQILVIHPDEKMNVRGEDLSSITAGTDNKTGEPNVSFVMSSQGSRRLGRLTKMNQPEDGRYSLLGIVLDDQLQSAPRINEPIYRRGEISGHFTPEETKKLEAILKSGKLAVALNKEPLSKDFINSTLGNELKRKGLWAIGASLILVLIFMVFYYRFAGIVATFGLLLNLTLVVHHRNLSLDR